MEDIFDAISAEGFKRLAERLRHLLGSGGRPLAKLQRIEAVRDSFETAFYMMLDVAPERQPVLLRLCLELLAGLENETLAAIGGKKVRRVA
jgi:hypothetical protein